MSNTKKNSEDLLHRRILKITRLLEKGRAGLNKAGRIVDLRKRPRACKISMSTLQASRMLMTIANMDLAGM